MKPPNQTQKIQTKEEKQLRNIIQVQQHLTEIFDSFFLLAARLAVTYYVTVGFTVRLQWVGLYGVRHPSYLWAGFK